MSAKAAARNRVELTSTDPTEASTFVISITPFTAEGAFDEDATRGHLRRLASSGIGVYLGGGGSGEGYTLSRQEIQRLLEIGVEELKGRAPVRAMGVEPRSSTEMIEFVQMAAETGVEAIQIYSLDPGHGHRPTEDEIYSYFEDVLVATDVPTVLSTHQSVGYRVPVAMVTEFVHRFPNLVGINCTHADLGYLVSIIDAVRGQVDIHVGGPHQALTALSLGANGFLNSEGNLAPRLCFNVIDAYRRGNARQVAESFGKVMRLSLALYGAGGITATKAVLNALGLPGGYPRRPHLPVSEPTLRAALSVVHELDLTAIEGW
jgi:4-hydroxy-tetrahydrodipicolinate synthase